MNTSNYTFNNTPDHTFNNTSDYKEFIMNTSNYTDNNTSDYISKNTSNYKEFIMNTSKRFIVSVFVFFILLSSVTYAGTTEEWFNDLHEKYREAQKEYQTIHQIAKLHILSEHFHILYGRAADGFNAVEGDKHILLIAHGSKDGMVYYEDKFIDMQEFAQKRYIKDLIIYAKKLHKTVWMISCYGDKKPIVEGIVVDPFQSYGMIETFTSISPDGHMAIVTGHPME